MSRAKQTWVWNKKFTVKTTTKLGGGGVGSGNAGAEARARRRWAGAGAVLSGPAGGTPSRRPKWGTRRRFVSAAASAPVEEDVRIVVDKATESDAISPETLQAIRAKISSDLGLAGPGGEVHKTPPTSEIMLKRLVELGRAENTLAVSKKEPLFLREEELTDAKRVPGCASRVWIDVKTKAASPGSDAAEVVLFRGHSDSAISRGMCAVLCAAFSSLKPSEFLSIDESFLKEVTAGLDPVLASSHHRFGLFSIFDTMRKRVYERVYGKMETFPSLTITKDDIVPQGPYAESQATYLKPDPQRVADLVNLLKRNKCGVVAHFYMDPEVQGVLAAAQREWPHIHISDSLVMADRAVDMAAKGGCERICVLGVDFMSENVRATLDHQGYDGVQVYRMDVDLIGCTLAEAAESEKYERYLKRASETENALHVVYINTSLKTKAIAQSQVPTITCTSSNVVQTILQSASQTQGKVNIFYGPDSYMGANIQEMLEQLAKTSDEAVKKVHPDHDNSTIKALLESYSFYDDGICLVHDMFGSDVASAIRERYADAFLTAHFEVPGEMFRLALHASHHGERGVIGSTKNILDFITAKVAEASTHGVSGGERLQFILGTESGMITSVVNSVQDLLKRTESGAQVEIVFPVSSSAIVSDTQANAPEMPFGLQILPGAASGEGCSMEGGCASCPYMKMNSLNALTSLLRMVDAQEDSPLLKEFHPRLYQEDIKGESFAKLGTVPILEMRHFQQNGELSGELLQSITTGIN